MKEFKIDDQLKQEARKINESVPEIITSPKILLESLLDPYWRRAPLDDIPANSQIFGLIAYQAGIQGILYPSKLTKKNCLAIYVHNFKDSSSQIRLDDDPPTKKVITIIDQDNWRIADLNYDEINSTN